jgi:hypothetical protein
MVPRTSESSREDNLNIGLRFVLSAGISVLFGGWLLLRSKKHRVTLALSLP